MTLAELRFFEGFIQDAEVELLDKKGKIKQLVHFPFLWDTKSRGKLAGMLISAHQSPREVSAAVSNVMTTFEVVQKHKFITKENCFVLVDDKTCDVYMNILKTKAHIVYINDRTASLQQIRGIFYKQSF